MPAFVSPLPSTFSTLADAAAPPILSSVFSLSSTTHGCVYVHVPASLSAVILSLPSRLTTASVSVFVVELLPMASLTVLSSWPSCACMAVGAAKATKAAMKMRIMFFFIVVLL